MLGIVCFNIIQRFETNEQFSETNEHLQTLKPFCGFHWICFHCLVLLSFSPFGSFRNHGTILFWRFLPTLPKLEISHNFGMHFVSLKINCYLITVNWLTQRQKCLIFWNLLVQVQYYQWTAYPVLPSCFSASCPKMDNRKVNFVFQMKWMPPFNLLKSRPI
jgi:hypothetical protein